MTESRMLKGDDGSALRFYWDTERNEGRSLEFGRPVYNKVLYLEVISPGQSQSSPVLWLRREFDEETKQPPQENTEIIGRYPAAYAAFMAGDDNRDLNGTPIEQWPAIDVAMAESMKASRIYTVEALAALPDEKLRVLGMGGRDLRARAQAYIDAASGNAGNEAMAAQLSQMGEELERVKAQLADVRPADELVNENEQLKARIAELEAKGGDDDDLIGKTGTAPAPSEPAKPKTKTTV